MVDVDKNKGNETFDVDSASSQAGGGLTSMWDSEKITSNVNDVVAVTPLNSGVDTGSAVLGGTMNALITQSGNSTSGAFQLNPESGNDTVNLNGDYHDKKVVQTNGFDPNTGDPYLFPAYAYEPLLLPLDIPGGGVPQASATITTQLNDTDIDINESDSDNAGQVAIGKINYSDNPSVTTTTAVTFTPVGDPNMGISVTGTMSTTDTNTQSQKEKVSGGGPVYQTDMTTTNTDTFIAKALTVVTWGGETEIGKVTVKNTLSNVHTIVGTDGGSTGPSMVDTTVDSSSNYFEGTTIGSNSTNYPLASYWKETNIIGSNSKDTSKSQYTAAATGTLLALTSSGNTFRTLTGKSTGEDGPFRISSETRTSAADPGGFTDGKPTATEGFERKTSAHGVDPIDDTSYNNDHRTTNPNEIVPQTGDWFQQLSDFSAGVADTITGGLTQKVRQKLGYDDAVNKNSPAYKAGETVGEVANVGLQFVSPCAALGWARKGIRAINAIQGVGSTLKAGEAFSNGDILGGLSNLADAFGNFSTMMKSCFVAGTPLLTPEGSKAVEQFQAGDLILTRDENDPSAPVVARRVLQTFVRVSQILNLHVRGRIIGTTAEHPFYVKDKGWLPAAELRIGDVMVSHVNEEIRVEGIADSGQVKTVYNLEVEEGHTYFVGCEEWGWSVWAHNAYDAHALSKAAAAADRGGLTKAGRSLVKHSVRPGSPILPVKGSPASINAQAQHIVDDILTSPFATDAARVHPRFGNIVEITDPISGRGLRYTASGDFLHFLGI